MAVIVNRDGIAVRISTIRRDISDGYTVAGIARLRKLSLQQVQQFILIIERDNNDS